MAMRRCVCDYVPDEDKKEPFIRGERWETGLPSKYRAHAQGSRAAQQPDFREQCLGYLNEKVDFAEKRLQDCVSTQESVGPKRGYPSLVANGEVFEARRALDRAQRELESARQAASGVPPRVRRSRDTQGIPEFDCSVREENGARIDLTGASGCSGRRRLRIPGDSGGLVLGGGVAPRPAAPAPARPPPPRQPAQRHGWSSADVDRFRQHVQSVGKTETESPSRQEVGAGPCGSDTPQQRGAFCHDLCSREFYD